MPIEVRRANSDDAEAIADLALRLVEQHVDYDPVRFSHIGNRSGMANYYASRSSAPEAVVLVAEDEQSVVGFAYMEFEPVLYAELAVKVAWLHDIFVADVKRREGAGRILIEAAAEEARKLGANKILLSVAAKNANAQAFFEQEGFRTTMHEMMLVLEQNEFLDERE